MKVAHLPPSQSPSSLPNGSPTPTHETYGELQQAEPNRSNRTKYACSCRVQVWGKPGLHLLCGDCGERFKAAG